MAQFIQYVLLRGAITRRTLVAFGIGMVVVSGLTGCQSLQTRGGQKGEKKGLFGLRGPDSDDRALANVADPMGQRSYNRFLLQDLAPGQIGTTLAVRTTVKEDRAAAEAAYAEGQRLYEEALRIMDANPSATEHVTMFNQAANKFRLAAGKFPDSQVEHDAMFYEGESYFFANHYVQSNRAFENLIARYSGSRYLDKAESRRFAIAQYWMGLAESGKKISFRDPARPTSGLVSEARRILHRIRLDDPTGKLADDATLALANAYFKDQRWQDAADTYEDLRRNYPGSQHQFHAHLFELKARINSYQGRSYDDMPLQKADKLMRAIVQQFPAQANEEQEYLAKEAASIRNQLAARDWGMAEYFENRGENRAAKMYYDEVASSFHDTDFADLAVEKTSDVATKPAEPPQHAEWLVNLFPDPEAAKPVIAANPSNTVIR